MLEPPGQLIICYHCSWGQLLTTYNNATEVARWACSSRPQPATDNGVRDGCSNLLALPLLTLYSTVPSDRHLHMQLCATYQVLSGDSILWPLEH